MKIINSMERVTQNLPVNFKSVVKRPLTPEESLERTYKHHIERLKKKVVKLREVNNTLVELDKSTQIVIKDLKKRNDELRIQLRGR